MQAKQASRSLEETIKVKLKMVIYIRFLSEQADAQGIQIQYWYWGPLLSQSLPMASEQTHLKQKPIKLASLAVIRLQVLAYLQSINFILTAFKQGPRARQLMTFHQTRIQWGTECTGHTRSKHLKINQLDCYQNFTNTPKSFQKRWFCYCSKRETKSILVPVVLEWDVQGQIGA